MGTIAPVMMVPISANAVSGVYCSPSHRVRPRPAPKVMKIAMYGDFHRGWVAPKKAGSTRIRPIAHCARTEAQPPPLLQAALELSSAMNSTIQPPPQTAVAIRFHGVPPPAG